MEGTLSQSGVPSEGNEPGGSGERGEGGSPRALWQAALYTLAWLLALAALLVAELLADPDMINRAGEILNGVSVVVWLLGVLAVPIGTLAIFRANQYGWTAGVVAGLVALLTFGLGSVLMTAIYTG